MKQIGILARAANVMAICLVTVVSAQNAERSPETPDLLGHWKFDDEQGDLAADASRNENDADIWNAQWVKGEFGAALHFNGADSYLSIPEIEGLDGSDELSVEAWVYWEGSGRYPNIITGGRWNPGGFLIFVRDNQCTFRMGRPGAAAFQMGGGWKETSAMLLNSFELNRWYHLAATFKRPTIKTYVNGKPVATAKWDYPVGYSGDILIGKWGGKACHKGLIDEVRIFNRALSAEEIVASYEKEAPRRIFRSRSRQTSGRTGRQTSGRTGRQTSGRTGRQTSGKTGAAPSKIYEPIPQATLKGPAVAKLENELAAIEIDERARCYSLIDKRTDKDYLAKPFPLAAITSNGKRIRRTTCSYEDGKLTIQFGKSKATAVIGLRAEKHYFVFEVLALRGRVYDPLLQGKDVDELTFLALKVRPSRYVSSTSGLAADEDFGVCLRALNLQTRATVGGRPPLLRAMSYQKYGHVGAKAALVASPTDQLRSALKEALQEEGAICSPLGGPWALDAEENRGSYVFARVSESNVDEWIELAKRAGLTHIHFHGWWQTLGHYKPNKSLFPNGLQGMKEAVRKIHAAGLKAGIHTLTGCISTRDPWVTPIPDKRLAADATYTLAKAMSEEDTNIYTLERPGSHDTIWGYATGGNVIRLDEELIHYSAISREQPYGFLNCTRGAFGTKVGSHEKGAAADHLLQRYLAFYPDENSTLVDEVADCIARVFNGCEMDMIYMDGAEGMGGWHAVAKMRQAIFRRFNRPVVVEASSWGHHSWPFHSRIGAWDHPRWGLKQFVDAHCEAVEQYRRSALLEAQLGWWAILGPSRDHRSEMPDEIEYLCCKALGYDSPISIQGVAAGSRPWNARQSEYMTTIGRYERLRLANYFSESIKARLREPGEEFRLSHADNGQWLLTPTDYAEHKVTDLSSPASRWVVNNRYAEQPMKLRIEALYSTHPYSSKDAVVVADPAKEGDFFANGAASGVAHTLKTSSDLVKVGESSGCYTAKSTRDSRSGAWCRATKRFSPHLNLGNHDALGVWIHGDGKGEILNVQLVTPREYMHAFAEHYVKIDFNGWRYFELLLRERDASQYRDYVWPYRGQHQIYRTPLNRAHVSEINLYLNNLPPNDAVKLYLSPIKAVRTVKVNLNNPTIELAGRKLIFPVTLLSGGYIGFETKADCRLYDERGALIARVQPEGEVPDLAAGENEVSFFCEGPDAFNARAQVTVITSGEPLQNDRSRADVNWRLLRREYEPPRTVFTLDGEQNRWNLICRPDANGVRLEMEMEVQGIGAKGDAYNDPSAFTLESFDAPSPLADSPDNDYTKYVYDSSDRNVSTKPGVTQKLEIDSELVKTGKASGRYTATSARKDNAGWSARGRRFKPTLDLSTFNAIGFWLHGDGNGEIFKVQLRDTKGGWHDMITRVDFTDWRYVEFDLSGAKLDLSKTEYLIIYYNAIPARQTVTCHADDIRALRKTQRLRRPALIVSGRRIEFPVELSVGDRLLFKGTKDSKLYRKAGGAPIEIQPNGESTPLKPGMNPVVLTFGPDSPSRFRLNVSFVKSYE